MPAGVLPVMKHIPGHGRAGVDSHKSLPVVSASRRELEETDFPPFYALCDLPLAMTAHVVYTAIDPDAPATTSKKVIGQIVRGQIGFDGLLMSDDLSMEALAGDLGARARSSLAAGCDVVLHCNGRMAEMEAVARRGACAGGSREGSRRISGGNAAASCRGTRPCGKSCAVGRISGGLRARSLGINR